MRKNKEQRAERGGGRKRREREGRRRRKRVFDNSFQNQARQKHLDSTSPLMYSELSGKILVQYFRKAGSRQYSHTIFIQPINILN